MTLVITFIKVWQRFFFSFSWNIALHTEYSWFSLWEKNTQNEQIIAYFEYFFTCQCTKTVWLADNLNEIKITYDVKSFLISSKNFVILRKGYQTCWQRKHSFVSLRLPLFSPRDIALKLNQKIITKISNYLT